MHGHHHHHAGSHGHDHVHGRIDPSIVRSKAGLRTVGLSLAVLGVTAVIQLGIFLATDSVALLADLIHNFGDAATAIPVGAAFLLRSERSEYLSGIFVVAVIFLSACVAGYEAIDRLINPHPPTGLGVVAFAGVLGFAGNLWASQIRLRGGRRLDSAALIADGEHAKADAYVSLGVVVSAATVAFGLDTADPLIGLALSIIILRITVRSWSIVRSSRPGVEETSRS